MDILGLWPNGFNHRSCLNWTVDLNKGHKSSQQFKWKLWESRNCKKGLFSMEITKRICKAHVGIIETSQAWLPRSTSHSFRQLLFRTKSSPPPKQGESLTALRKDLCSCGHLSSVLVGEWFQFFWTLPILRESLVVADLFKTEAFSFIKFSKEDFKTGLRTPPIKIPNIAQPPGSWYAGQVSLASDHRACI